MTLQLPISSSEPADVANQLNLLEFAQLTDTSLLGAWCPDPTSEGSVAFTAFLPNVIAQPGILENTLLYLAGRVSGVIDARRSYPGPLSQDDEVPESTNGSVSDRLGRPARIVAHSIRRSLLGV